MAASATATGSAAMDVDINADDSSDNDDGTSLTAWTALAEQIATALDTKVSWKLEWSLFLD